MNGKMFPFSHPSHGFKEELPEKKEEHTFRFDITLTASHNGYAEINFKELTRNAIKEKKIKDGEELDSTQDNPSSFDGIHYDKVIGYDTADSFIDDSELFDEYVPPIAGGFCIHYNKKPRTKKSPSIAAIKSKSAHKDETIVGGEVKLKEDANLKITKPKKLKLNEEEVQIVGEIIRSPLTDITSKNSQQSKSITKSNDTDILSQADVKERIFEIISKKDGLESNVKDKEVGTPEPQEVCPVLPPNLPNELLRRIELLIMQKPLKSGKVILNEPMKILLLEIEKLLLTFNVKVRSDVFSYLACSLSVSSKALKQKSKTLMIRKLTNDLDSLIKTLADEIKKENPKTVLSKSVPFVPDTSSQALLMSDHAYNKTFQDSFINSIKNSVVITPSIPQNASSNSFSQGIPDKVLLTPAVKDILLKVFGIKKELFDVQRLKHKNFYEDLAEYLKEDILYMWLPSQRRLQALLDLAREFCLANTIPIPQITVNEKVSPLTQLSNNPTLSITCSKSLKPLLKHQYEAPSVSITKCENKNWQMVKKSVMKDYSKVLKAESCLKPQKMVMKKSIAKPKILKDNILKLEPDFKNCYVKTNKTFNDSCNKIQCQSSLPQQILKDIPKATTIGECATNIKETNSYIYNPSISIMNDGNTVCKKLIKKSPMHYPIPLKNNKKSPSLVSTNCVNYSQGLTFNNVVPNTNKHVAKLQKPSPKPYSPDFNSNSPKVFVISQDGNGKFSVQEETTKNLP